jgi:hypothetical protein
MSVGRRESERQGAEPYRQMVALFLRDLANQVK